MGELLALSELVEHLVEEVLEVVRVLLGVEERRAHSALPDTRTNQPTT